MQQWAQPQSVGFNLVTFPSQQYIVDEPLGVALIISTWNYPLLLALTPALGAIAAGNVVLLKPVRPLNPWLPLSYHCNVRALAECCVTAQTTSDDHAHEYHHHHAYFLLFVVPSLACNLPPDG